MQASLQTFYPRLCYFYNRSFSIIDSATISSESRYQLLDNRSSLVLVCSLNFSQDKECFIESVAFYWGEALNALNF